MWSPPDPKTYNALVWKIARQIPAGKVSSYGQIASMIPPPEGVLPGQYDKLGSRWVGKAMRDTPSGEGVPWHRVINSQGSISLPEGSPPAVEQRARLEAEGVVFSAKGKVNFDVVGWDGPASDWLQENGLFPPKSLKKHPHKPEQKPLF
jgi:methylated-DNA-protein-cysteine methyltransferase related protein